MELQELLQKQQKEAEGRDARRRADQSGLSYLNLVSTKTPTEIKAIQLVKEKDAKRALLVPVQLVGKKLIVAVYDPNKKETKEIIKRLKNKYKVGLVISSMAGLKHAWSYYGYIKDTDKEITGSVNIDPERIEEIRQKIDSIEKLTKEIDNFKSPYISKILELILAGGMALKASDIHLEPGKDNNTMRLRIDGLLHIASKNISSKTHRSIVTRIKLLSEMKLNVKDEPQDGRFTISLKDREVEIRTSVIPSEYGETVVMRILDPNALKVKLEELGWRKDDLKIIKEAIEKPNGLILNTGPTGSGKTTTLYAFLRKIANSEIKIITVEDPIEYHIGGISQTQVDKSVGYTFASGLRSILRQDPDVILVGEIRDKETAEMALNASLTGHMVFSTLHTNDAVGAIPRMVDLGTSINVVGPGLSLVIAQRLVRKLCDNCKKEKKVDEGTKNKIRNFLDNLPERVNKEDYKKFTIFEAGKCSKCNNLGYKGRTSIFELFLISDKMEELMYQNPNELELKKAAEKEGMVKMQEDGILKVLKGITSFDEVERLTGKIQW